MGMSTKYENFAGAEWVWGVQPLGRRRKCVPMQL